MSDSRTENPEQEVLDSAPKALDRRWIFLAMLLAVAIPMVLQMQLPELPSPKVRDVFATIERLQEGSRVLVALDYDPTSEGELRPMAAAFVRHCCERKLKIFFVTLWDRGPRVIQKHTALIRREYPDRVYGEDYVDLGYKAGERGAIKNAMSNMEGDFVVDHFGTSLSKLPMMRGLRSFAELDLIISAGAGSPGPQEWIQYGAAQYNIGIVVGSPGVQAPQMYPYLPKPLNGILAAIKGAAEYEVLLIEKYPHLNKLEDAKEGWRRMGPQSVAHLLMVGLILLGNAIHWSQKRKS